MSFTVTVPTEEWKTVFYPMEENCVFISPNGQFCCFLIQEYRFIAHNTDDRRSVKALQFIDLSKRKKKTKVFKFEEETGVEVTSVYWINENYIVFLTVHSTSFKQIMFKVNFGEEEFLTKVCERSYNLHNEIATNRKILNAPQVTFHGDGYIAWTDRRQEKGSCTGLYLIPENPMNSELRLRKFAMFLSYKNRVAQARKRIYIEKYGNEFPYRFDMFGPPFLRNNRLLFCISEDWGPIFFGVFLAVDIEKLIEVKGLNYDPIEIENKSSAYSMEEWTSLIDREDEIYSNDCIPVQVGKYMLLDNFHRIWSADHCLSIINMEDLSFTVIRRQMKKNIKCTILHPFGFLLTLQPIYVNKKGNIKIRIGKQTGSWKGKKGKRSSLKDLARRSIMLSRRTIQRAMEIFKAVIYQG